MTGKFSIEFIAIDENNPIQLAATNEDNIINLLITKKGRAIKEVDCSGNKVDNFGVLNTDSTRFVKIKLAKSKNLI